MSRTTPAFPMAISAEDALIARITDIVGRAIAEHAPDLVVVACNTASTLALDDLRARFTVPFVGTVPAIKPACAQSKSKRVAVLGTQATVVARIYPRADPRIRRRLRCRPGRLVAPCGLCRGRARRQAGRRCRDQSGNRRAASSTPTAGAPTPWCWPARIIRC